MGKEKGGQAEPASGLGLLVDGGEVKIARSTSSRPCVCKPEHLCLDSFHNGVSDVAAGIQYFDSDQITVFVEFSSDIRCQFYALRFSLVGNTYVKDVLCWSAAHQCNICESL